MWVWHPLFAPGARPLQRARLGAVGRLPRAHPAGPADQAVPRADALGAGHARAAPQLAELRKRYGDDRRRLAEETQKLQRAHGVNPLGACLPALIQLPVFLALLHVLRYFNRPGLTFEQNAALPNYVFGPAQVRSFLEARLFGAPLSA